MKTLTRNHFAKLLALLAIGVAALLSGCAALPTPSATYNTANRLVFPLVSNLPADNVAAINHANWGSGFQFSMEDGGMFPAAKFRGLADDNNIYIRVKVEDSNFDETDVVVIALNPTNAGGNYHRIHVFPCFLPTGQGCDPTAGADYTSRKIDYATGGASGTTWTDAAVPAGVSAMTRTTVGVGNGWEVLVRIPRGGVFNFKDDNFFGLFVDVARTDPGAGIAGEAVQYTWPPNQFIGADENDILGNALNTGTLPPSAWGNATLCPRFGSGVRVDNLGTNHPTDPNKIRLNAPNVFHATAANYTLTAGTLVTAQDVKATFTIANNGLPSLGTWANVPVGGNPTSAVDIAPTVAHTYTTGTWNLTSTQQAQYAANTAQCVKVTLSSTDAGTVITQPTTMRNMTFVNSSSPFRERAFVNPKGFEPRRGERTVAYTLREQFVNFDPKLSWTSKIENATLMNPRLYRANATPNTELQLGITVEPPRMVLPKESLQIAAGTGGAAKPAVKLAVRPGELLTFVSSGSLGIAGQSVTAFGTSVSDRRGEPLLKGRGTSRIGAVIGSFDGFKESAFIIGNASTIKVPSGANELQVKINDDPDQYAKQDGAGYVFEVVRTATEPWMVVANPEVGRAVRGDDVFVALGSNLPTWMLRGERDTGKVITIGKKTFRVFESVGSFGYMVKTIH